MLLELQTLSKWQNVTEIEKANSDNATTLGRSVRKEILEESSRKFHSAAAAERAELHYELHALDCAFITLYFFFLFHII